MKCTRSDARGDAHSNTTSINSINSKETSRLHLPHTAQTTLKPLPTLFLPYKGILHKSTDRITTNLLPPRRPPSELTNNNVLIPRDLPRKTGRLSLTVADLLLQIADGLLAGLFEAGEVDVEFAGEGGGEEGGAVAGYCAVCGG